MCATCRLCTRTCRRSSAPWPRRRSSSPTCRTQPCSAGPAAWPSTTWARTAGPGTGMCPAGADGLRLDSVREAGGQTLLPFSLLGALASFLLLPLPRSVTVIASLPEEGENEGNSAPLALTSEPLREGPVPATRWNSPPFLPPSGQVLGSGQGGYLGCGLVRRLWPVSHRPGTVSAQPG